MKIFEGLLMSPIFSNKFQIKQLLKIENISVFPNIDLQLLNYTLTYVYVNLLYVYLFLTSHATASFKQIYPLSC